LNLQYLTDYQISSSSSPLCDAVVNGSNLCVVDKGAKVYYINLSTLASLWSPVTAGSVPAGITLVNSASALVGNFSGTTNVNLVELSGGYVVNYSGSDYVINSQKGQQMAGDTANNRVLFCSKTTATKLGRFDGNTFVASTITVTGINTGKFGTAIIIKGSDRWLVGTNDGIILETDHSGNNYNTITLPTTPNTGTAPTHIVSGLSYDVTHDKLAVVTASGLGWVYNYSAGTIAGRFMVGDGAVTSTTAIGTTLCDSASGYFTHAQNLLKGANTGFNNITLRTMACGTPTPIDCQEIEFGQAITATGFCTAQNLVWVLTGMVSPAVIRFYSYQPIVRSSVLTRIQTSGVDKAGRIIRIKYDKPGVSIIESDGNIAAGAAYLDTQIQQNQYIEIALSGSPETADIRGFGT